MTTYEEYLSELPEERRRKLEEQTKLLLSEVEFWASLPETERNKRLEKPKVSYDSASDTLWLKNGRPTLRSREIVENRVTVYFESEIWYPSAVSIVRAYEMLGQFFCPKLVPESDCLVKKHGVEGGFERSLKLKDLEVFHETLSDYLWIGIGEQPWDGAEIAEDLIVSYAENGTIPVGVAMFKAAELIGPLLATAHADAPFRLV